MNWEKKFIEDMWAIGLLVERCAGCAKIGCDGCPCGTTISIDYDKLTPEAATKLKQRFEKRMKND